MMSWAAQTHLTGHMRPVGRVFETPVLEDYKPVESIDFIAICNATKLSEVLTRDRALF